MGFELKKRYALEADLGRTRYGKLLSYCGNINKVIVVKMDKQEGTRKLHAIEFLVEDGFLVISHARGYESPKDIGTDKFTVIYLTELPSLLPSAVSESSKSN